MAKCKQKAPRGAFCLCYNCSMKSRILALLVLAAAFPHVSAAQTLSATLVSTSSGLTSTIVTSGSSPSLEYFVSLGHGLNNRLGSIWVQMASPVAGGHPAHLYALVSESTTYITATSTGTLVASGSTTPLTSTSSALQVIRFDGTFSFDPSKFYAVNFTIDGTYSDSVAYLDSSNSTSTNANTGEPLTLYCYNYVSLVPCSNGRAGLNFNIQTTLLSVSNVIDTKAVSSAGVFANCSITDISGCISNALAWAFIPSQADLNSLADLRRQLASTSPFGYAFDIGNSFVQMVSASSTSFVISANLSSFGYAPMATTVPILSAANVQNALGSSLWTTMQTWFAAGLWLLFASYIWYRFRTVV